MKRPDECVRLGEAARARAFECFGLTQTADGYEALYRQLTHT